MTHTAQQISDSPSSDSDPVSAISDTIIWDRNNDGGFPETKELKNRVRNIIQPDRDLGHIDRSLQKSKGRDRDVEKMEKDEERPGRVGEGVKKIAVVGGEQKSPQVCEDCN